MSEKQTPKTQAPKIIIEIIDMDITNIEGSYVIQVIEGKIKPGQRYVIYNPEKIIIDLENVLKYKNIKEELQAVISDLDENIRKQILFELLTSEIKTK